jgi:hypothetical protein
VTDVPVAVFRENTLSVDIDIVFEAVTPYINKRLPEASFRGLIFSGKCQDLPQLRGTLVMVFVEKKNNLLGSQVTEATASIDTINQIMDIEYVDYSDLQISTQGRQFIGQDSFVRIAALAYQQITEQGLIDCDVTLTQRDESWDVRCGSLGNFIQKCRFDIQNDVIGN